MTAAARRVPSPFGPLRLAAWTVEQDIISAAEPLSGALCWVSESDLVRAHGFIHPKSEQPSGFLHAGPVDRHELQRRFQAAQPPRARVFKVSEGVRMNSRPADVEADISRRASRVLTLRGPTGLRVHWEGRPGGFPARLPRRHRRRAQWRA